MALVNTDKSMTETDYEKILKWSIGISAKNLTAGFKKMYKKPMTIDDISKILNMYEQCLISYNKVDNYNQTS